MNNMGGITEIATAFPGNTGQRPNNVAPLAEMLRLNGYSTAFFGKNHETAAWEVSPSGPTDRWPTRSGFDKFYGFIGGETDQWAPTLYDGMTQVGTAAISRLQLHDRHDRPGHPLDEVPEVADAGQAVLHLLRPGRHARAASRARRNGSPSTRASSTGAGTRCAKRRWRARSSWASCRRARSSRPSRRPSRTGTS